MNHHESMSLKISKPVLVLFFLLSFLAQFAISYSFVFKSEMNCSQFCSCYHNALVNTMKQYNVMHYPMMGEKYRPQISYFDAKSEYMAFLGTFAPILHRISEISCSLSDGQTYSIMSLLNGVDDLMDTALDVTCVRDEKLIWDVPSWHITLNIFVSKNCNIVPKATSKFLMIPMNLWILDVEMGGHNILSLLDLKYSMNTLTLSVMGSSTTSTPKHWDEMYMVSASFLSFRGNGLEEFHCPFKLTKRLDTLNLEKNRLPHFPECVLHPKNIHLTYLSLADNKICDLTILYEAPESSDTPDITIINLSYNHIKSVEAIRDMGKLVVLDLSNNAIKDITVDAFHNLNSLEVLYLSNNKIIGIGPKQFASNFMLSVIDLRHNGITSILPGQLPSGSFSLALDVRQNKLMYPPFRDCAKNRLDNFNIRIFSAGNPFYCDCYMIEFEKCQQWVKDNSVNYSESQNIFKDLESMVCADPGENRDIFLSEISFNTKCIVIEDCPEMCSCSLLNVENLVINCSGRRLLEMPDMLPTFYNVSTALYLDHNPLQMLSHRPYLRTLSELHMDNCLLSSVTPAAMTSLQDIRVLTLHNNLLQKLPSSTRNITLNHARNVTLYGNRWACTCDSLWLPRWITKHKSALWMPEAVICHYLRKPVEELSEMDLNCNSSSYIDTFLAISLTLSSLVSTLVIAICYRSEISVLLYSKLGLRLDCGFTYGDFFTPYDAFVSYSQDTHKWVVESLVPRLESGTKKYRLCLHYRDFPKGDYLIDSLPWSIRLSRCAILVLSKDVIKKEWCIMEVRAAFQRLLLVANKLLIIVIDNINIDELSLDLRSYMYAHKYLSYDDPCFWEKLEMFLPPKDKNQPGEQELATPNRGAGDSFAQSTPDRFEEVALTDISDVSYKPTDNTELEL